MSTKIAADNGATIEVGQLGITVVHPEGIASIWARLAPEKRRALADALDPARPAGGQWTRADIDRALINVTSNAMNYPTPSQMLGKDSGPLRRKCVDAMCELLGIKDAQAADPVEAKVTTRHPEHYRLVNEADGSEWRMNRAGKWLPADLLGQEADQ